MRDLLWLIPVLPLAGVLVNGILYLVSHRTHGEPQHGHEAHSTEAKAAPSPATGDDAPPHASAPSAHVDQHPHVPFKGAHVFVSLATTGLSCLLAFAAILDWVKTEGLAHAHVVRIATWIPQGVNALRGGGTAAFSVDWAFRLDPLSALMISFVTFVGFLIHVYSVGYMGHEEGFGRFFAYLNLFMFSMLLLVLGANFVVMFTGWEGVGLCSYLLIGYYYEKDFAADAGKKAFVVNRIGDLGFALGIFGIFAIFGSLDFGSVFPAAAAHPERFAPWATVICLCLFVGAMGKSAQVPLYVWLPDAMAGPTPVSALIHAATMVTAGIYMVVRCNVLFRIAPAAMNVVAIVGCVTAILAASMALVQNDIKKVLAYSTISQLGYMFLGCGVGAFVGGIFHVFTHAFFKACLFLGSGSVIHAMAGEQDMRKMGGLKEALPTTRWTYLVSTLAIAGIFPFAGFFSKDEILGETFGHHRVFLWGIAIVAAVMTAFYMFRSYFMTFTGTFRGTEEQRHHLHESPGTMTWPLRILAVGAVLAGFVGLPEVLSGIVGVPHALARWLSPIFLEIPGEAVEAHLSHGTEAALMVFSVTVAVIGIGIAWRFYTGESAFERPRRLAERFPAAYRIVFNKYYVDEAYDALFVEGLGKGGGRFLWDFDARVVDGFFVHGVRNVVMALSWISSIFDQYVVDGMVNGVAGTLQAGYRGLRRAQTGRVQNYAFVMGGGFLLLVAAYLIWR
ncbi:MAG TPA: NADH-quinone oxidoreductase subunit L [Thermoanaerobaculia bacterium]|nr:NADH-quinone oxidoreductase subunit L [Thermoanaerobaculia bacterium]